MMFERPIEYRRIPCPVCGQPWKTRKIVRLSPEDRAAWEQAARRFTWAGWRAIGILITTLGIAIAGMLLATPLLPLAVKLWVGTISAVMWCPALWCVLRADSLRYKIRDSERRIILLRYGVGEEVEYELAA